MCPSQVLTEELLAARAARDSALAVGGRISASLSPAAAAASATAARPPTQPLPPSVASAALPLYAPPAAAPASSTAGTLTTTLPYPPTSTLGDAVPSASTLGHTSTHFPADPPSHSYPADPPSQAASEDDTEALLSRVREQQRQWRRTTQLAEGGGERGLGGQTPLPLMPGNLGLVPAPAAATSSPSPPPAMGGYSPMLAPSTRDYSGGATHSFHPASTVAHCVTSFRPASSSPHRDRALEVELLQVRAAREGLQAALLASAHRATAAATAASEHPAATSPSSRDVRYDGSPAARISPRPLAPLSTHLRHLSRSQQSPEGSAAAAVGRSPSHSLSPPSSSRRLTSEQAAALSALAGRPFATPQAPRSSARRHLSSMMPAPTGTYGQASSGPDVVSEPLSAIRARLEVQVAMHLRRASEHVAAVGMPATSPAASFVSARSR